MAMTEMVTPAAFARQTEVSKAYISKVMANGKLPFALVGGRKMIDPVKGAVALKSSAERLKATAVAIGDGLEDEEFAAASPTLLQHRIKTEYERGELLALQRAELEGRLIELDEVMRAQETAARIIRRGIEAIPMHADDLASAAKAGGSKAVRLKLREIAKSLAERMAEEMTRAATLAPTDADAER